MDWRLGFVLILSPLTFIVYCQDDQMPPKMISTFNSEYYFPMNSKLTDAMIECNAMNGKIEYEWKKDGVIVRNSKYVYVDKDTGTLKFNEMQGSDYGTYQCFAKNDFGISLSIPFEVKMALMGAFPSKDHKEIHCKEYEHCKIPCRDKPECLPDSECRVEWKIGLGAKTNVEISKRIGVDGNGDLHFIWTTGSDWTGLNYKCGVWQEQLKMLVVGSITTLRIQSVSRAPSLDPILVYKSNGKAQYRGEGVLKCMFSGYAAPDIEWISPADKVINNSAKYVISDFNRMLTIKDAIQNDEGPYYCRGKGNSKINTQQVFLNVTSAPMLKESENPQMNDLLVSTGKNATFYCQVISLPEENAPTPPQWMKNGAVLPVDGNNTGKYILRDNNQTLIVTNVQKGLDTGAFQCMSENSEGVLLKEALLKVIDPITILKRPQGSYKIMPGDTLSLGVSATSEPSLSLRYKWTFINVNGEEQVVKDSDYWRITRPTLNNLTIDVSQVSDPSVVLSLSGVYIVDVFHNYDSEKIKVTVETEIITTSFAPKALIVQKANLNFIIYIAGGVIFLIILSIFVLFIVRRNRGGVHSVEKKELAAGHDPEKELLECGFHDLSRADDDGSPNYPVYDYEDEKHITDDDDDSLGEYDVDQELNKFNEDGSFIGLYADKKTQETSQV
ncbi:neurofascin-like [Saccostrea echinata]|uniref:neurofascin-like n=1 Tax=Saccostrea echinata TaxID=191078 RepID=UPI002A81E4C1|nr:neurofascin-like [Saccostrea echinata]